MRTVLDILTPAACWLARGDNAFHVGLFTLTPLMAVVLGGFF